MSRGLAILPGMLGSKANKLPSFLPSAAGVKEVGGSKAEKQCGSLRYSTFSPQSLRNGGRRKGRDSFKERPSQ